MALFWRIVKRIFSSVFLATVTLVGAPVAFGATVLAGLIFLPLPATIPIPKANPAILPTILYDRYGNQIASLQRFDTNVPVTEAEIPQILKEAVISDEDRNYYHHGGVDLRGTVRALWADLRNQAPVQGGSTITQQYVKLAYTNKQRTVLRKVKEAILASQLARQASKDEILYRYLTLVYFGDGNYGVGAAAQNYFHIPVSQLNASQAAALAGLIPAPSARAPRENLQSAETARELVLKKMFQQGYLTAAQYRAALAAKLALQSTGQVPAGSTVVYPYQSSATAYPDFVDYVTRWLLKRFPAAEVYSGGLRVQTTLDPAVQSAAYTAVRQTLSGTADPIEMAMAAVEPATGFVPAVVGGRDFGGQGPYAQDNLAIGGCDGPPAKSANVAVSATCWSGNSISGGTPGRQPGSSWKPFVLATAFGQGIQPTASYPAPGVYEIPGCKVLPGQQASTCQVHNDEPGSIIGSESLAQATVASTNTVYAQVAPQVGCPNVATTAKKIGIDSAYYSTPPFYYCSTYALGEIDVSPLEMASAYGVFADHGQRAQPTPVLEIVNAEGKVLLDNIHPLPSTTSVLPANVADNVTNVLQGVITGGTGTAAKLGRPAAGKTGTTSNYTNAWFVGYTPTLSAAVWMGNANSQSKGMGVVKGVYPVYGGTWPAITWRNFMSAALAKVPATPFTQPAPIVAPQAAAALGHKTPPTTAGIEPGPAGAVSPTPAGGPYRVPSPAPPAPPPASASTVPEPTTTVPTGPPGTPYGGPVPGG